MIKPHAQSDIDDLEGVLLERVVDHLKTFDHMKDWSSFPGQIEVFIEHAARVAEAFHQIPDGFEWHKSHGYWPYSLRFVHELLADPTGTLLSRCADSAVEYVQSSPSMLAAMGIDDQVLARAFIALNEQWVGQAGTSTHKSAMACIDALFERPLGLARRGNEAEANEFKSNCKLLRDAAYSGDANQVALLLPGRNPKFPGPMGMNALHAAATSGVVECLQILLPHSDPEASNLEGQTALHLAAIGEYADCVKALLPVSDANVADKNGLTALHFAAQNGHPDCLQVLLPVSDPRAVDKNGQTALHHAAIKGHAACVQTLLPESDVKAVDRNGMTAAAVAKMFWRNDCVSLIESFELAQAEREALASIAPVTEMSKPTKARSL